MSVHWRAHVLKAPGSVSPHELERLESAWGIKLPDDYKRVVSMYQGMAPEPNGFRVGRGDNALGVLLTVSEHEGRESYSILNSYEVIRSHVPSGIFPFARTPGGEDLCFDYRGSPEQPRIVLVSVEGSVHLVANSFQEFMDGLSDD